MAATEYWNHRIKKKAIFVDIRKKDGSWVRIMKGERSGRYGNNFGMIRTGTYGKLMNDYFAKTDVKEFSKNFANQSRVTNSVSEDSAQTLADAKDTASALLNPEKNTYTDSAKYSPLYSAGSMWDSFF